MTTTELKKLLEKNEIGGISKRPRVSTQRKMLLNQHGGKWDDIKRIS